VNPVTAASATLPNFFIIGAPKCGTTSLYRYLEQHPQVFFPLNKEPKFFCDDILYAEGLAVYAQRHYHDARGHAAIGDASPHYLYYDKAARRIRDDLPDTNHRFLVILRDPVARAYSHYWNMVYEGFETLPFEQALAEEPQRIRSQDFATRAVINAHYVSCGLYAQQLQRWLDVFDESRFLILFQDELVNQPQQLMERVFDFLGLSSVTVDTNTMHNPSGLARSVGLQRWLRRPSRLRQLVKPFTPYSLRFRVATQLAKLNKQTVSYPPLDEKTAARLRERFAPDIEQLKRITGQDLSSWCKSYFSAGS